MRVRVIEFPISSLWREPVAYALYRKDAAVAFFRHCFTMPGKHEWAEWHAEHGNPTYDRARWVITGVCAAGWALYNVNEASKNMWSNTCEGASVFVAGAIGGAIVGRYAHITVPVTVAYTAFGCGFSQLQSMHQKKKRRD